MRDDNTQRDQSADELVDQSMGQSDHGECEQRLAEAEGKYRRALADYQNLERQTAEQGVRFAKLATREFVERLIEPYDHLLLASKHISDKGLDMVIAQFRKVFEEQGLEEINPVGKDFDPTTMEAVDTKEGEDGKIIDVASVGYQLNGIVIKEAKVVVGKKE